MVSCKAPAKKRKLAVTFPAAGATRSLTHESKTLADDEPYTELFYVPPEGEISDYNEKMGSFDQSNDLVQSVFRAVLLASVSKKTLTQREIKSLIVDDCLWLDAKFRKKPAFWAWLYSRVNDAALSTLGGGVALAQKGLTFPSKSMWILVNRAMPESGDRSRSLYDVNATIADVDPIRGLLMVCLAVITMKRSTSDFPELGVVYSELLEDVRLVEQHVDAFSEIDVESGIKTLVSQKYLTKKNTKTKNEIKNTSIFAYDFGERALAEISPRDVVRYVLFTLDVDHVEEDVIQGFLKEQ